MRIICVRCKGRGYCGRAFCPHLIKASSLFKISHSLNSSEFATQSPAPFVGRIGYPNVSIGLLSLHEPKADAWQYDSPSYWASADYGIQQIVDLRSSLINSLSKGDIHKNNRLVDIGRQVAMASKPVDVEIKLEEKPKFSLTTDPSSPPYGPSAKLVFADITSNPKIDRIVEQIVDDTDFKAMGAAWQLFESGYDENFIAKLFSIGSLGLKSNRKLVPTRWSITATDDMLAKQMLSEIKDYPPIEDNMSFFGSYLGNYYLFMLFPEIWSYELFETYMPNASWNKSQSLEYTTDYEGYDGRKSYAENCAGGYYSVRLALLEKLRDLQKQAGAIVIRVITGEYFVPLGVWVTREAARKTFATKPLLFDTKQLMLDYAIALFKKKFGLDINGLIKSSVLLKRQCQTKITNYI
ncbi:MAG: hypothetical protein QXK37_00350 [Candidatus Woesearchaeota archaeon]